MQRASVTVAVAAITILVSPVASLAQSAGGSSAGSSSAAGSPNAGSAGAGTSGISGVPSGPASPGGLNNAGEDPSGAANSSNLAAPPGTNSAGTAQSSGAGVNTGAGRNDRLCRITWHGNGSAAKQEHRCCHQRGKQDDRSQAERHLPRLLAPPFGDCRSRRSEQIVQVAQLVSS